MTITTTTTTTTTATSTITEVHYLLSCPKTTLPTKTRTTTQRDHNIEALSLLLLPPSSLSLIPLPPSSRLSSHSSHRGPPQRLPQRVLQRTENRDPRPETGEPRPETRSHFGSSHFGSSVCSTHDVLSAVLKISAT